MLTKAGKGNWVVMNPMIFTPRFVAAALFATLFCASLQAAVVVDPPLVTSGNKIAPYSTGITHTATGATAEATLEARSGLSALQDFTSFSGTSNIASFTSATLADISITGAGGTLITNASFYSSAGNALRIQTAATGSAYTHTVAIDFGSYVAGVFDGSTVGVEAAAFTLNSTPTYVNATALITATFRGANNQVLSTQTFTPSGSPSNSRIYFGYESVSGSAISSIQVDITTTAAGAALIYGFDDLAFTGAVSTIPEPSVASLLVGFGALGMVVLLRRPGR